MRIRSIKPEFWRSEDITCLPIEDRLLFVGLWSYVDDNGVGKDNVSSIVADLFAEDLVASPRETLARMHRGLDRLSAANMIVRYEVSGRRFLCIVNWTKHQKIDRPSAARYPGPDQAEHTSSRDTREDASRARRGLVAGSGNMGAEDQGAEDQFFDRSLTLIDPLEPSTEEAFDDWWTHVRRKVSKPAALTAFTKATTKIGGPRSAATHQLIEAIEEHQRHWFDLEQRSISKTPHPATWLNNESWNDELPEDSAYRSNNSANETPTERINRMRAETQAGLDRMNGDANGNTTGMQRPALNARVS